MDDDQIPEEFDSGPQPLDGPLPSQDQNLEEEEVADGDDSLADPAVDEVA